MVRGANKSSLLLQYSEKENLGGVLYASIICYHCLSRIFFFQINVLTMIFLSLNSASNKNNDPHLSYKVAKIVDGEIINTLVFWDLYCQCS